MCTGLVAIRLLALRRLDQLADRSLRGIGSSEYRCAGWPVAEALEDGGFRPRRHRRLPASGPLTLRPASRWQSSGHGAPKRCRAVLALGQVTRCRGDERPVAARAGDRPGWRDRAVTEKCATSPSTRSPAPQCASPACTTPGEGGRRQARPMVSRIRRRSRSCSIGGNIATNAGGLCCVKVTASERLCLGIQGCVRPAAPRSGRWPGSRTRRRAFPDQAVRQRRHAGHHGVTLQNCCPHKNPSSIVVASAQQPKPVESKVTPGLPADFTAPRCYDFMISVAILPSERTLRMDLDRDAATHAWWLDF